MASATSLIPMVFGILGLQMIKTILKKNLASYFKICSTIDLGQIGFYKSTKKKNHLHEIFNWDLYLTHKKSYTLIKLPVKKKKAIEISKNKIIRSRGEAVKKEKPK